MPRRRKRAKKQQGEVTTNCTVGQCQVLILGLAKPLLYHKRNLGLLRQTCTDNVVLEYLRKQNRPYSVSKFCVLFCLFFCSDLLGRVPSHFADDVHSNLHGKVPKTAVEKMLQTMADEGKISVKVNGKQKIFVARQVLCSTRMQA